MSAAFQRSAVSRADLARLLAALPPERVASAATSLGFERIREPDPDITIAWIDPDELDQDGRVVAELLGKTNLRFPETSQRDGVRWPHWRLETMQFEPEPTESDVDPRNVQALSDKDMQGEGRSLFATPSPTSLTSWSRLWPHLRAALQSTMPSREPDVTAYIRALVRGESMARIPCMPRRAWAHRFSLWIDRSKRLVPFWSDQTEVCRRLQNACDRRGLDVRLLDARAQASSRALRGDLLAGCSLHEEHSVLVLGDLGVFGSEECRDVWRRTGRRLLQRGVRLSALVPCSSGRFLPFMMKTWNAIAWERGRQRHAGQAWQARTERLMKMVSPAALVQPGLLRAIRLLLPPSQADASTEADVWNHLDVRASSGTAWVLRPDAAAKWRMAFVTDIDPDMQNAVSRTMRTWHDGLPRELLRGETLMWHELLAGTTMAHETPGDWDDALAFAQRLRVRIERGGASNEAIARYGWSLLQGLPENVVDQSAILRTLRDKLEGSPKVRHYAIRQVGRRLVFSVNERGPAWPSHVDGPGSPVAWLEAARPWVHVDRAGRREQMRLENGLSLPADPDEPMQLRTDRCTVTLTPWRFQDEPDWTAAGRDRFGLWALAKIRGVAQRFRWLPPGRFLMGSPENEAGRFGNEGPQHGVTFTQGRWLADTPVTQALWKAVTGNNPSEFQSDQRSTDDRPVEQVTWNESAKFVETIGMRLPSEAEWEHACRAGTTTATWVGDVEIRGQNNAPQLDAIAWYGGNCGVAYDLDKGWDTSDWPEKQHAFARGGMRVVGIKEPNPFGLYDMLGNVHEWCGDAYVMYANDAAIDPVPIEKGGALRVRRGGSWLSVARRVRAADRFARPLDDRLADIGLRLVRDATPGKGTR